MGGIILQSGEGGSPRSFGGGDAAFVEREFHMSTRFSDETPASDASGFVWRRYRGTDTTEAGWPGRSWSAAFYGTTVILFVIAVVVVPLLAEQTLFANPT